MATAAPEKLCIAIVVKRGSDEARTPLLTSLINMQYSLAVLNVTADLTMVESLDDALRQVPADTHLLAVETDVGFDPRFVVHALQAPHDVVLLPYPVGIDWSELARRKERVRPGTAMLHCTRYSAEPAFVPDDDDAHYAEALPGAGTACVFVRKGARVDGVARLWARDKPPVIDLKFNAVKAVRMAFAGCVGHRAAPR